MDMVFLDPVVPADGVHVPPIPAARDTGVKVVMDMVVADLGVEGMHRQNPDSAVKYPSSGRDLVVGDGMVAGSPVHGSTVRRSINFYPAGTGRNDGTMIDTDPPASIRDFEGVPTDVFYLTIQKLTVPCRFHHDHARHVTCGLETSRPMLPTIVKVLKNLVVAGGGDVIRVITGIRMVF